MRRACPKNPTANSFPDRTKYLEQSVRQLTLIRLSTPSVLRSRAWSFPLGVEPGQVLLLVVSEPVESFLNSVLVWGRGYSSELGLELSSIQDHAFPSQVEHLVEFPSHGALDPSQCNHKVRDGAYLGLRSCN